MYLPEWPPGSVAVGVAPSRGPVPMTKTKIDSDSPLQVLYAASQEPVWKPSEGPAPFVPLGLLVGYFAQP